MCGLIGWAGKDPKKFNKDKFNILGILNEVRGTDSCGVTTDGEIYFGIKKTSEFRNFLVESSYNIPTKVPTVFGHTRNSSKGSISKDNIHPFGFGSIKQKNNKDPLFEFVGAHNGTLRNESELSKKYDIEDSHNKIDSQILLEIIYKSKNFKVLSEYIGGAALLFSNLNEPNIIYAFHGASSLYKNGTKEEEERPLFYYRKGKNDLYISSLESSLVTILDNEEDVKNIHPFETNKVYKITDGDIDNAEIFDVSRKKVHQKEYSSYGNNYTANNNNTSDFKEKNKNENSIESNILQEKVHNKNIGGTVYYENLRYKRNGHLVNGIFTYINNFGLLNVGFNKEAALQKIKKEEGNVFNIEDGYFLNRKTIIEDNKEIVPFKKGKVPMLLFIIDGVLFKDEIDYNHFNNNNKLSNHTINQISHCSEYPVCNIDGNKKRNVNIFQDGHLADTIINPIGSDRIYHINKGKLEDIETIEKKINLEDICGDFTDELTEEFSAYFIEDMININNTDLKEAIEEFESNLEVFNDIKNPIYNKMENLIKGLKNIHNTINETLIKDKKLTNGVKN